MEKFLVEIFVPAAETSYDLFIPQNSKLGEVMPVINAMLSDLSCNRFIASIDSVLCNRATGDIYDINIMIHELGIRNGSELLLI